jgi:hypothetical protein
MKTIDSERHECTMYGRISDGMSGYRGTVSLQNSKQHLDLELMCFCWTHVSHRRAENYDLATMSSCISSMPDLRDPN